MLVIGLSDGPSSNLNTGMNILSMRAWMDHFTVKRAIS
jgi:hypothetical protein